MNSHAVMAALSISLLLGGCGVNEPLPVGVARVPFVGEWTAVDSSEREWLDGVNAVASVQGSLFAGGLEGLHQQVLGAWEAVPTLALEGLPSDPGAILRVVPRDGGLLVLGETGLFTLEGGLLIPSAILEGHADRIVKDVALERGEEEVVWVALETGLLRLHSQGADDITIPGASGAPVSIAVSGYHVGAVFPERIVEIDTRTWQLTEPDLPGVSMGAIAGGEGGFCVNTSEGLLVGGAGGSWSLHGSHDGEGLPVATDGSGECVGGTPLGILWTSGDEAIGIGMDHPPSMVAVDEHGELWSQSEEGLLVFATGDPPSFLGDVSDVFASCSGCHGGGSLAPDRDFSDYGEVTSIASDIHARVNSGQMPPGGMNETDLATLNAWFNAGMNP